MPVETVFVDCFAYIFSVLAEQAREYLILCLYLGKFFNEMTSLHGAGMCWWTNAGDVK